MSFEQFITELSDTNTTLDSIVDFDKVIRNVESIAIKLNQLNYLLGQEDMEEAIRRLYKENSNCFTALKLLVAVRDNKLVLDDQGLSIHIDNFRENPEKIFEFINSTGLIDIFKAKHITNLTDYVFGIEVGLDTNARKNRGGKIMEALVTTRFQKSNIKFKREVKHTEFKELKHLGADIKRFDFVIQTSLKHYLIETNYYNSGGSKLNEVARAYKEIALKINQNDKFEFVWITDGKGWFTAKNKLEEAFHTIPRVYNLNSLSNFIQHLKNEGF